MTGLRLHDSRTVRLLCIGAGFVALVLGLIGIVVPVLPTTPFVLLAAACFARSSQHLHDAMLAHRIADHPRMANSSRHAAQGQTRRLRPDAAVFRLVNTDDAIKLASTDAWRGRPDSAVLPVAGAGARRLNRTHRIPFPIDPIRRWQTIPVTDRRPFCL